MTANELARVVRGEQFRRLIEYADANPVPYTEAVPYPGATP
ncbi:hypothetical protein [Streptomyces sp. cmx-18-6]